MPLNIKLVMLLSIIATTSHVQNNEPPSLNIGDPAPPLRVQEWIKGDPVQRFEKGKVYVIEFWATWCLPCIAAMPHLSALANEYRDKVIFIGIKIGEKKTISIKRAKVLVDSLANLMDYQVAAEDSNFMVTSWLDASGEQGIPKSFVVDAEGRLAWIGYPRQLEEVLPKVVNNTWDKKEALAKRNLNRYLAELDDSARQELNGYVGNAYKQDYIGKPDSALLRINEILKNEPRLKYAPFIASHTFSALLKTNPHKAYEYGKVVLATPTYEEPAHYAIIGNIIWYSDKLDLPPEIYKLGAEAYLVKINQIPYPQIADIPRLYKKMAEWYWRANDKSKAIATQEKAIEALKNEKEFSEKDLAAFESRLQQYKM